MEPEDSENFRRAITPSTKAFYAETSGNPKLDVIDFQAVADIAHAAWNGRDIVSFNEEESAIAEEVLFVVSRSG